MLTIICAPCCRASLLISTRPAFLVENRSRLDHLLYDVGIDYRMEGDELKILKSGYYGFF